MSIRQIHRWVSMVLVIALVSYPFIAKLRGLPQWILYAPALPFIVLVVTGLYLFAKPCPANWRRARFMGRTA